MDCYSGKASCWYSRLEPYITCERGRARGGVGGGNFQQAALAQQTQEEMALAASVALWESESKERRKRSGGRKYLGKGLLREKRHPHALKEKQAPLETPRGGRG